MKNEWYFLTSEFWSSPLLIAVFTGTVFSIVLLRYLVLAVAYRSIIGRVFSIKINNETELTRRQWRREILWSTLSSLVFAVLTLGTFVLYRTGYTQIYPNIDDYPLGYFFLSMIVILILYETYYYWLHRWMHRPGIFRVVHKVHHESVHTSVFTSFSFHPVEAGLQFAFLPVAVCVIPLHVYAIGTVLILMTISAIVNHAGVEIFPATIRHHPIGRWLIGATHHDLHHKEFRTNFGLYFTFWDKWMKTESQNYPEALKKNARLKS